MAERRTPPSRIELRVGLERQRADFLRLVDDITDAQWGQRSANTGWTNGEVLAHLLQHLGFLPRAVDRARRGQGMLNYPAAIAHPVNYLLVKRLAGRYKRSTLKSAYSRAIDDALAALDGVRDDEWQQGAHFFGQGFHDIEQLFRAQAAHFAAHTADVRAAIGQGTRAQGVASSRRRR